MPLDPTLDELAEQPQQRLPQKAPGPSPEDIASMTHQPEQPNPAAPYLQRAQQFFAGSPEQRGLAGQLSGMLPGWMNKNPVADVWRNPEFEEASSLGILKLGSWKKYGSEFGKTFKVLNEGGNHVADLSASLLDRQNGTHLHVGWLGSVLYDQPAAHSLGLPEIRTLLPEIEREYPKVRRITATRASGARRGEAASGEYSNNISLSKGDDGKWRVERPEKLEEPRKPQPAPAAPEPSWDAMRQRQNSEWDAMQQRQNSEWSAMMQRLFGPR